MYTQFVSLSDERYDVVFCLWEQLPQQKPELFSVSTQQTYLDGGNYYVNKFSFQIVCVLQWHSCWIRLRTTT